MRIDLLLEGHLEEPVAKKILRYCGHEHGSIYGKQGVGYIKKKAAGFLHLVNRDKGLLVLTDFMDSGCPCPAVAHALYTKREKTTVPQTYLLRFAVRELESWLLADRKAIAKYLLIDEAEIPEQPEQENAPKKTIVLLARKSPSEKRRAELVPSLHHGGVVGPGYLQTMINFVNNCWRPEKAREHAPSLARCIERLRQLR